MASKGLVNREGTIMNPPKVLDFITTEKSGHQGVVLEVVENRTGSYRVKYLNRTLEIRWTTVTGRIKND